MFQRFKCSKGSVGSRRFSRFGRFKSLFVVYGLLLYKSSNQATNLGIPLSSSFSAVKINLKEQEKLRLSREFIQTTNNKPQTFKHIILAKRFKLLKPN